MKSRRSAARDGKHFGIDEHLSEMMQRRQLNASCFSNLSRIHAGEDARRSAATNFRDKFTDCKGNQAFGPGAKRNPMVSLGTRCRHPCF
ncbi:MAG: hypothetical protein J0L57_21965, partial [Burkholderiales bacterium]|nr:hypothetical protein [Burkholderiales bacterium]